eukprot:jgi/Chlat1/6648/Chrsp49S06146
MNGEAYTKRLVEDNDPAVPGTIVSVDSAASSASSSDATVAAAAGADCSLTAQGDVSLSLRPEKYPLYRLRWFILVSVGLLNASNAAAWFSFAPIASITADRYDVSLTAVNWLAGCYMAIYVPLGFASTWALDVRGLRVGTLAGAVANAIGLWIRYIGDVAIGDGHAAFAVAVTACAQPFLLGCTTKFAARFFGESERGLANCAMSFANPVGIAIASVLSPVIVSAPPHMKTMLLSFALFGTASAALALLVIRERPPLPPSASAARAEEELPLVEGFKRVFSKVPYVVLFLSFGLALGVFNALTTLLEQIVKPYGYSSDDAGLFGGAIILGGLFGAVTSGIIIDKTKRFAPVFKLSYLLALSSILALVLLARSDGRFGPICAACGLLGFFAFAILPCALEMAVECTWPAPEATSAGFLWWSGQAFGGLLLLVMNALRAGPSSSPPFSMSTACYVMLGAAATGCGLAVAWRGRYRRHEMERRLLGEEGSGYLKREGSEGV